MNTNRRERKVKRKGKQKYFFAFSTCLREASAKAGGKMILQIRQTTQVIQGDLSVVEHFFD